MKARILIKNEIKRLETIAKMSYNVDDISIDTKTAIYLLDGFLDDIKLGGIDSLDELKERCLNWAIQKVKYKRLNLVSSLLYIVSLIENGKVDSL